MLYLEDYLEMIENLPIEMRDRFTEIREMDLQVQNAMDSVDDRVKNFFKKCGATPTPKVDWKDEQFKKVKEDYKNALEDADEKVQLANQIYDLLERHLRKLDQELSKFKMELEADNAGITEVLEKRSLELDQQPRHMNNHRAEKRKYMAAFSNSNHVGDKKTSTEKVLSSLAHEAAKETLAAHRSNSATSSPATNMFDSSNATSRAPALSYNLSIGHVGTGGSNAAIAQAASRAIGATLEMGHGRRTASLKASYEAVTKNPDITKDLLLRDGTSTSTAAPEPAPKSSRKKGGSQQQQQQVAPPVIQEQVIVEEVPVEGATGKDESPADWMVDPNEPRYCLCNEVSYGEMVGCDNDDCPIEWFHYGCVGLTQAPKGKWYCPQCKDAMKRRGRK